MIVILAAVYLLILAFAYKVSGGTNQPRILEALELSGLLSMAFCGILVAVVAVLRVVVFNNPV